ncbi:hypothetical protein S40288_05459 [Stachybotrys chartarum IBT 40288]|nr:hypothetical protein S40288_05459 [Stachybotrys chartarum IBT 40288]
MLAPAVKHRLSLLAVLALAGTCWADDGDDIRPTAVTTAPVFLPYYDEESWSIVRGSILESNATARETTYTIFCPVQTPPSCDLSLEFPFIIVEGPDTVDFHGTLTSTYIADLGCDLEGTTEATCSGYSSYASGFTNGPHTGPTEFSWTTTLAQSEVEWGVLTMAEIPETTDNALHITAPVVDGPTVAVTDLLAVPTGSAATANVQALLTTSVAFASTLLAVLLL